MQSTNPVWSKYSALSVFRIVSSEAPSAISMLYPGILTVTAAGAVGTRGTSPAGYSGQWTGLYASSIGTTSCLCLDGATVGYSLLTLKTCISFESGVYTGGGTTGDTFCGISIRLLPEAELPTGRGCGNYPEREWMLKGKAVNGNRTI